MLDPWLHFRDYYIYLFIVDVKASNRLEIKENYYICAAAIVDRVVKLGSSTEIKSYTRNLVTHNYRTLL